ncbi:MAG: low molecular weight protein-tyrosine-phosphatase [Turneriella sp.]
MRSVLFVCLGNICRSPLAQGIFEHQIRQAGLAQDFDADSAGTSGWHEGEPPHRGSIRIAKKYGISIEKQRSRPVHPKDAEIFDYIIAMDTSVRESLLSEFRFPESKVHLMRSFSPTSHSLKDLSVPDPWGMNDDAFENVYQILDDAITGFIGHLRAGRI